MLKAMTRVAETIETRVAKLNEEKRPDLPQPVTAQYYLSRLTTPDEILVQVEEIDFVNALNELVPSVSATELAHYSKVREKFEQKQDEEEQEEKEPAQQQLPQVAPSPALAAELLSSESKSNVNSTKKQRKDKGKGKARVQ